MRRSFENMNEKNETKTIRFKKELNNEFFWVRVAMPKDMTMTIAEQQEGGTAFLP
jgi:hypothetical protein